MKTLLTLLLTAAAALAQLSTISAPASPTNASGGIVGAPGYTTYYYMVIANYPAGSTQSNIVSITNGNATLNSTNYNAISWTPQPNAINYDVLLLATNSFSGSCTCSVTTATTATSYNDQSGTTSSYTVGSGAGGATGLIYLDTVRYSGPKLRVQIQGTTGLLDHLAEIASGNNLPAYCLVGDFFIKTGLNAGGYACLAANAWTPVSISGTTGALIPATVGTGGVTAGQLVKFSGATVVKTLTSDTAPNVAIGIAQATASAGAAALIAVGGVASCVADTGGITAGNLVGAGTTVADTCVDLGQSLIASVAPNIAVLGRALTTASATGTASIYLFPQTGAGYAATGTGNYVRATSPTLVTPLLGTPTSVVLTNATGLQVTCGATAACPNTAGVLKIVSGSGTLSSGSPSTYAVTAISPAFTSASTYTCTAQDTSTIATNIGVLAAGYVSGSAVTFTGPNTNTDGFHWSCIGY